MKRRVVTGIVLLFAAFGLVSAGTLFGLYLSAQSPPLVSPTDFSSTQQITALRSEQAALRAQVQELKQAKRTIPSARIRATPRRQITRAATLPSPSEALADEIARIEGRQARRDWEQRDPGGLSAAELWAIAHGEERNSRGVITRPARAMRTSELTPEELATLTLARLQSGDRDNPWLSPQEEARVALKRFRAAKTAEEQPANDLDQDRAEQSPETVEEVANRLLREVRAETVYLSRTGTKYHRQFCRTLKRTPIRSTMQDALRVGREPCKVCKP